MELNTMPRLRRIEWIKMIFEYAAQPGVTRADTAEWFDISPSTLSRLMRGLSHQADIQAAGVLSTNTGASSHELR